MNRTEQLSQAGPLNRVPLVYSATARRFHWLTVAVIAVMLPLGEIMTERGADKIVVVNGRATTVAGVWDATTNALYSSHKLIGFTFLFVILARLYYRLRNGAPPDEPSLEPWQKYGSHLTHWALYALLVAVPLGGWIGVQLFPALGIFGLFNLPAFLKPNEALAGTVFKLHSIGAKLILLLVAAHVGAAMYHHFVRKDGVLRRMLPTKENR
jgi:cytochrome b561